MKLTFQYPYLLLHPDQFEAQTLATLPWALSYEAGTYCYWTRIIDLVKHFKLDLSPEDIATLTAATNINPSLSKVPVDPNLNEFFTEHFQPRPYQLKAMSYLLDKKHVLLADPVGLGKSLISMGTCIISEFREPSDGTIVVVCPSGIRWQWRSEIMKMFRNPFTAKDYAIDEDLIQVLDGEAKLRKALLKMPARKVFIVSYDILLRELEAVKGYLKKKGVSGFIFDESSRFKTPSSKTFATVAALTRDFKPRHVFCLNATPIENNLDEFWSQMFMVQPTIFPSFKEYDQDYVRRIRIKLQSGMTVPKVVGHQNLDHLKALVKDRYVRRNFNDVEVELPEVIVQHRFYDLGEAQDKIYQTIRCDPTMNALERVSALVRAALFVRNDTGDMLSAKFDELPELLKDFSDDERVIFVTQSKVFAYEVTKLLKKFQKTEAITGEVPDEIRAQIVRDFTAGTIRYLVGTEAIERGLNLQAAGIMVHLDLPWTPASYIQRLGRVRRLGSKHKTVRSINMIANDTAEEYVFRTIYEKHNLFQRVFGEMDVAPVDMKALAEAI